MRTLLSLIQILVLSFGLVLMTSFDEALASDEAGSEFQQRSIANEDGYKFLSAQLKKSMSCRKTGSGCMNSKDCCNGNCQRGTCTERDARTCTPTGSFCTNDEECCSNHCEGRCADRL